MGFNKDFVWGVATSSYQIEGAYNEDGKGESIWDVFSNQLGKVFGSHNGNVACDHYHRFKDDVKLMKELGIKAYRFSISWPRLFPNGTGELNEKGAAFYSELIDELIANGIEPYITLFHWDFPYELHKKGGWLSDESVDWFAQYAAKVVELYSDRVKYFITFNEPQCFIGLGYHTADHAPGIKCTYKDLFLMTHNVLKAHGAAVVAMRASAKQDIKIGYAPTGSMHYPSTDSPEDIEAAREELFKCPDLESFYWNVSWFSDPVILGRYPDDGLAKYKDYLPQITKEDMELISQPIDFYAQNIYNGWEIRRAPDGSNEYPAREQGYTITATHGPVTPRAMQWGLRFLYERYKKPIYVTENGMAAHDTVSLDGKVHDPNRIDFLHRYFIEMEKAIEAGADVRGYFEWSFMDNFEWSKGYMPRFGIVYVDYATQERIVKDSGYWYKNWIEEHTK